MLDPKLLRENIDDVYKQLKRRGFELDVNAVTELDAKRKSLQVEVQNLQNERNVQSKKIGQEKAHGQDVSNIVTYMGELASNLAEKEVELNQIQAKLQELYFAIPNIPDNSVPDGKGEKENVEVRRWGEPKIPTFKIKDHIELGEALGMMDFQAAAKITGARFVVLKSGLARMQRALTDFMLDLHTQKHGYKELYVPHMVNSDSLLGTGQLPKFAEDLFHLDGSLNYYLIPTAEVPVTNLVRDEIIAAEELPLKFVAHTPCYRSESGSYGKDMRGMIRHHQFEKVELVQIVKPKDSYKTLEELTADAEKVLQLLEIPYRVVALSAGDLGFSSAKTYDIEVWLPGQGQYREISSCSNFESFQARRMQARWRNPDSKKPELVHTLNGSGLAVGRTLIAVMEHYQDVDGNIHVPQVLRPYMNVEVIKPD